MAIAAAVLYFSGDPRGALITAGQTVLVSCLVYTAAQRRRVREAH